MPSKGLVIDKLWQEYSHNGYYIMIKMMLLMLLLDIERLNNMANKK